MTTTQKNEKGYPAVPPLEEEYPFLGSERATRLSQPNGLCLPGGPQTVNWGELMFLTPNGRKGACRYSGDMMNGHGLGLGVQLIDMKTTGFEEGGGYATAKSYNMRVVAVTPGVRAQASPVYFKAGIDWRGANRASDVAAVCMIREANPSGWHHPVALRLCTPDTRDNDFSYDPRFLSLKEAHLRAGSQNFALSALWRFERGQVVSSAQVNRCSGWSREEPRTEVFAGSCGDGGAATAHCLTGFPNGTVGTLECLDFNNTLANNGIDSGAIDKWAAAQAEGDLTQHWEWITLDGSRKLKNSLGHCLVIKWKPFMVYARDCDAAAEPLGGIGVGASRLGGVEGDTLMAGTITSPTGYPRDMSLGQEENWRWTSQPYHGTPTTSETARAKEPLSMSTQLDKNLVGYQEFDPDEPDENALFGFSTLAAKNAGSWKFAEGFTERLGIRRPASTDIQMKLVLDKTKLLLGDLPPLYVEGNFQKIGTSVLSISTSSEEPWVPLDEMPELDVAGTTFSGELRIDNPATEIGDECESGQRVEGCDDYFLERQMARARKASGLLSARFIAGPLPDFKVGDDFDVLTLSGWSLAMTYGTAYDGTEDTGTGGGNTIVIPGVSVRQGSGIRLTAAGKILVRLRDDDPGFAAKVQGTIQLTSATERDAAIRAGEEPPSREGLLALEHEGGWKPFPDLFPSLETPPFVGWFKFNSTGREVGVIVSFASTLSLLPDKDWLPKLELKAPQDMLDAEVATGPVFECSMFLPRDLSQIREAAKQQLERDIQAVQSSTSSLVSRGSADAEEGSSGAWYGLAPPNAFECDVPSGQVALNGFYKVSASNRDTTDANGFMIKGSWLFEVTKHRSAFSKFEYGVQKSSDLAGGHCVGLPGSIDQGKGHCATVSFQREDVVSLTSTNAFLHKHAASADKNGPEHTEHIASAVCNGEHEYIHKINTRAPTERERGDWFDSIECCSLHHGFTALGECEWMDVVGDASSLAKWEKFADSPSRFGGPEGSEYEQARCPAAQVMKGFEWYFASTPTREGGLARMYCCQTDSLLTSFPPPMAPPPPAPPQYPPLVHRKVKGQVCLTLQEGQDPACLEMGMTPRDAPFSIHLGGAYTGGDLRPLAFLGEWAEDVVVLRANGAIPLVLNLEVDLNAFFAPDPVEGVDAPAFVKFDFSATLFINMLKWRLPAMELSTSAIGMLSRKGLEGAFIVEADKITLPGFGELPGGVAMSFSTIDSAYLPFLDPEKRYPEGRFIPKGIGLYWRGTPQVLAAICPHEVFLNVSLTADPFSMMAFLTCPMDKRLFDRHEPKEAFFKPLIPSIEYVRLKHMRVGAGIQDGGAAFELAVDFEMATANPSVDGLQDACAAGSTSALCIKAETTSTLLLQTRTVPTGLQTKMMMNLEIDSTGAWLDPLGFGHFAIIDVKLAFGVMLDVIVGTIPAPPYVSVQYFAALPGKIGFAAKMYWKRYGSWPDQLLDRAAGWPPADMAGDQIRELETIFLYEGPKGNELPVWGVRLACPVFKLEDFPAIFLDVMRSLRGMLSSGKNAEPVQKELPETFEFLDVLKEYFDMTFGFEFETSLVTDEQLGLNMGSAMGGSATGVMFGKQASIGARLAWHPGGMEGGGGPIEAIKAFAKDPMALIQAGGLALQVNVSDVLPMVPVMFFYGKVSATSLVLDAAVTISFTSDLYLDCRFAMDYQLPIPPENGKFKVLMFTDASFPVLGTLFFNATIDIGSPEESGDRMLSELQQADGRQLATSGGRQLSPFNTLTDMKWEYAITARINMLVFGFCMSGSITGDSKTKEFEADLDMRMEGLGYFTFYGKVTPSSIYIEGDYAITGSGDDGSAEGGFLGVIIDGIAGIIGGDDGEMGIVATAVFSALKSGASTLALDKAYMLLDSSKFELFITMTITCKGVTNDIELGLPIPGRRRHLMESRRRQLEDLEPLPLPSEQYENHFGENGHGAGSKSWDEDFDSGWTASKHHHARRQLTGYDEQCGEGATDAEGRRLAEGPGLSPGALVAAMRERLSFDYILGKIGDIDKSFDFSISTPLFDGGLAVSARAQISQAEGIRLSFSASFDMMGISLSGTGMVATDGWMATADIQGTGTLAVPGCNSCPSLTGSVQLQKLDGQAATLGMSIAYEFFGISCSGDVTFKPSIPIGGGLGVTIASFRLEGVLDTTFTDGIKNSLIQGIAKTTSTENPFVKVLDTAFGLFEVTSILMFRTGGPFVTYEIGLTINDEPKTLKFKLIRMPTNIADFFGLIGQLGVELLSSLAPLDKTIETPNREGSQICAPPMPCMCGPELYCGGRRARERRQLAAEEGGTNTEANVNAHHADEEDDDDDDELEDFKQMLLDQPYTAPQPHEEISYEAIEGLNRTLATTPFENQFFGHPNEAAMRRELGFCRPWKLRLRLNGCCGTQRFCINSRLKLSGSLRLKITSDTAYLYVTARMLLQGPGGGLSSIDKSITGMLKVDYGSATSLCDLVPGLKDTVIGSIGGGDTEICAFGKCLTINLPSTNGIRLYNLLPCNLLSI